MNKTRYVEKDILCKYDLSEEFFEEIGINVEDMIPLRKVFVLMTSNGKKILKIVNSSEEKLEFIDEALKYVSKKYSNVLSYYKNKKNMIYEKWEGNTYVILDMLDGREATFSNPLEIELCAKAISNMHLSSLGISDNLDKRLIKENVGINIQLYLSESKNDLLYLKEFVQKFKHKNEFDNLFIKNVDYNIQEIDKSVELLNLSEYNLILNDKSKEVLCHNDLAYHNFIINGQNVKIIDFDYCAIDTRIVDVANYIIKVIKNSFYDIEKVKIVLDNYNLVQKLDKDEIKILHAIMTIPKDFITIIKGYYYKQKAWEYEVFLNRLSNKLDNEIYRKGFLDSFNDNFKEYLE